MLQILTTSKRCVREYNILPAYVVPNINVFLFDVLFTEKSNIRSAPT